MAVLLYHLIRVLTFCVKLENHMLYNKIKQLAIIAIFRAKWLYGNFILEPAYRISILSA